MPILTLQNRHFLQSLFNKVNYTLNGYYLVLRIGGFTTFVVIFHYMCMAYYICGKSLTTFGVNLTTFVVVSHAQSITKPEHNLTIDAVWLSIFMYTVEHAMYASVYI